MRLTGERTLPGIPHENYWFRRHEVVYQWTVDQLLARAGERVLDAGCGEGYGAALLRRSLPRARVSAVDYDPEAAAHVRRTYAGIDVVRGNLVQLPFATSAFDAAVSLQTVEHLWDQRAFVAECARVVRPHGVVVLSTPNRLTFPPGNICHARELTGGELRDLLTTPELGTPVIVGLHHGDRIRAWERRNGDLVKAQLAASPKEWPQDLTDFVADLSVDDFDLGGADLDSSSDLLAVSAVRAG